MISDLTNDWLKKIVDGIPSSVSFSIKTPNGTVRKNADRPEDFSIEIKNNLFWRAILTKDTLGAGEQFMLGNLEITGDFDKALTTLATLAHNPDVLSSSLWFKFGKKLLSIIYPQTKEKSLRDIAYHYDLGNDFFQQWLDPTMTYSCAYFKTERDSLELAQKQKYEHICRKLLLKPGEKLIDVGCGWGGMLIYAAQKYKVFGYGITLSKNQYNYATAKVKSLKLDKQIKIELKDYRDIGGQYDKFVSIGMFEHVTLRYYNQFFQKVVEVLKPGGIGVLHTIGRSVPQEQPMDPWILNYIFPGGYVPSAQILFRLCGKYNLPPQDFENLRLHYALTLKCWAENYMKIYDQTIKERGEKFARMWKWYLYMCRAGFVVGLSHLYQITFTNGVNNDYPLTRDGQYGKRNP